MKIKKNKLDYQNKKRNNLKKKNKTLKILQIQIYQKFNIFKKNNLSLILQKKIDKKLLINFKKKYNNKIIKYNFNLKLMMLIEIKLPNQKMKK